MAVKNHEINLLPSKWKLPSSLRRVEKKLRMISLGALVVYIGFIGAIFAWIGAQAIQSREVDSQIQVAGSQLSGFKQVEASEAILKQKTSFAQKVVNDQIDAGLGISRVFTYFPESGFAIQDLNSDARGAVNLNAVASSAGALSEAFGEIESQVGTENSPLSAAVANFDVGASGKILIKLNLSFIPDVLKLSNLK